MMATVVRMSDVKPEPVRWLWRGWIPLRKLSVLEGEPDNGKSTLTMDLVARVSRGETMPGDMFERKPENCLILAAEDGAEDTIRPRLDAAGADTTNVYTLSDLHFPRDSEELAELIHKFRARLVVIDPLTSFLSHGVSPNNSQDMRQVLGEFGEIARVTNCAILVVRHLNKGQGMNAKSRGGGSIDITAIARSVMVLGPAPHDRNVSVLASVKCNLAEKPKALGFRKFAKGDSLYVAWESEPLEYTADEIVGGKSEGNV